MDNKKEMEKGNSYNFQAKVLLNIMESLNIDKSSVKICKPQFLQYFNPSPVILVSLEKPASISVEEIQKHLQIKNDIKKEESLKLETIGNPLESPFTPEDMDLLKNPTCEDNTSNQYVWPLTCEQARQIQFKYVMEMNKTKEELLPIYFVCDGFDENKIVLFHYSNNNNTRGYAIKDQLCDNDKLIELRSNILNKCKTFLPQSQGIKVDCTRILEYHVNLQQTEKFLLKIVWKENNDLDSKPSLSASASLEVKLLDNYTDEWMISSLNQDMEFLKDLFKLLNSPIKSPDVKLKSVAAEGDNFDALDLAQSAIEQSCSTEAMLEKSVYIDDKDEKLKAYEAIVKYITEVDECKRPNMDFTDYVWNSFKYLNNLSDLQKGLNYIFHQLLNSNPQIFPHNQTFLAQIAKRVIEKRDQRELPLFTDPVGIIMEIGYIKLVRDLVYICQAGGLMIPDEIHNACGLTKEANMDMGFDVKIWKSKIEKLNHMLASLELTLRSGRAFKLDPEPLKKILFKSIETKINANITVNFQAQSFMNSINTDTPCLRTWIFNCTTGAKKNSSRCVFSCKQLEPFFSWAAPISGLNATTADNADSTEVIINTAKQYFCASLFSFQ